MNKIFAEKEIKYTGNELCPHWIYKNFNMVGNSICAFVGEVEVNLNEMVDIEDVLSNEPIYSKKMLNFIIEQFEVPLSQMILNQRIFIAIIKETLEDRGIFTHRSGDDLFFDNRKLTVSIATKSPTSSLIHTAINIVPDGAPIEVSSLSEFKIEDIKNFANEIMNRYSEELQSVKRALCKVRGVF